MALGRGLDALLGDASFDYERELSKEQIKIIKISDIEPNPFQPRKNFDKDALNELAQSIEKHGLIQPVVLINKDDDSYMLVAGERRLRATQLLGLDEIKAVVLEIPQNKLRELAIIENIQRADLNPLELASSLNELINEHNLTQEELANTLKKSRSWVTNTLRLLNLDDQTKELISAGKISSGHAKMLVGLSKEDEKTLANSIAGQKLSVRETEKLVKKLKKPELNSNLEEKICELKNHINKLGIKANSSKNKLTIDFNNIEEIEKLIAKLSKI